MIIIPITPHILTKTELQQYISTNYKHNHELKQELKLQTEFINQHTGSDAMMLQNIINLRYIYSVNQIDHLEQTIMDKIHICANQYKQQKYRVDQFEHEINQTIQAAELNFTEAFTKHMIAITYHMITPNMHTYYYNTLNYEVINGLTYICIYLDQQQINYHLDLMAINQLKQQALSPHGLWTQQQSIYVLKAITWLGDLFGYLSALHTLTKQWYQRNVSNDNPNKTWLSNYWKG